MLSSDNDLADWAAASGTTGIITKRLLADPTVRLVTVHQWEERL